MKPLCIPTQSIQNQNVENSQADAQPEVPIVETQSLQTPPLRRSSRVRNIPLRYGFIIENDNISHIIKNDDLATYSKSIMSSDSDKQLEAKKFKMDSMYTYQVWILVDALEGVTPIGYKQIFKKKIRADGQVETYKARLVAKDFGQR